MRNNRQMLVIGLPELVVTIDFRGQKIGDTRGQHFRHRFAKTRHQFIQTVYPKTIMHV